MPFPALLEAEPAASARHAADMDPNGVDLSFSVTF
jgi:hypothetical protein